MRSLLILLALFLMGCGGNRVVEPPTILPEGRTILGNTRQSVLETFRDWRRDTGAERILPGQLEFKSQDLQAIVRFTPDDRAYSVTFMARGEDRRPVSEIYTVANRAALVRLAGGQDARVSEGWTVKMLYVTQPDLVPPDPEGERQARADDLARRVRERDWQQWYDLFRADGSPEDEAAYKANQLMRGR